MGSSQNGVFRHSINFFFDWSRQMVWIFILSLIVLLKTDIIRELRLFWERDGHMEVGKIVAIFAIIETFVFGQLILKSCFGQIQQRWPNWRLLGKIV